ncbi:MAG TPA: polysaccharide deacetylase family protein [Chthonomonadaceae bacterium]|nr:polysaccharide deacetylase family protein [Chthonomonadaceae bacterium]
MAAGPAGPASPLTSPPVYPVFYDERRRRWPWFLRAALAASLLFAVGLILLIISLIALPLMPRTPLPKVAVPLDLGNPDPLLNDHERRQLGFKQGQDKQRLSQLVQKWNKRKAQRDRMAEEFVNAAARVTLLAAPRPSAVTGRNPGKGATTIAPAPVLANAPPVVAGFYVNWEETSHASAHRNIDFLTHFIPEWLHLKPAGTDYANPSPNNRPFIDAREPTDKQDITPLVHSHRVAILPLLNNFTRPKGQEEGTGDWDTRAVHEIVSNPRARANIVLRLRDWLLRERMQGINIDFEEVDSDDRDNLVQFMKELYAALHPRGLLVTQDVQLESEAFNLPELAKWNDWLIPMFYDEHTGGTPPGPVAGIDWTRRNLQQLLRQVPAAKIVMGVGNHAYDWRKGDNRAEDLTYQSAIVRAKESQPDAVIHLDYASLNPTFSYSDTVRDADGKEREEEHVVWMQDAVSVYNQLCLAKPHGIRGAALWFMGSEDPSLWSFYSKAHWNDDWKQMIEGGALNLITYGGQAEVDFENDGELLQPFAGPSDGHRTVTLDPKTGLITAQAYVKDPQTGQPMLPSSFVVRRYGGKEGNPDKKIVLTFDDGPDPLYTPQILDILKRYHVPAVFFVVGENAEANPDLVRRMWDEGHEIGNHSYTHPDLFRVSPERQRIELTLTQRVIQSITGHSTLLFRPPYGGDTEPQTGAEVVPMLRAADLNYITVGEKNDPQDWRLYFTKPGTEAIDHKRPRTADDIVKSVVVNRDFGSVVLLHDGGGDRTLTIEALPQIITQLRRLGYTFTTISDISGFPRGRLMPPLTGKDTLLVGADHYVFEVTYWSQRILTTLFTLSVILGVSRVAFLMVLALIQRRKEKRQVLSDGYMPSVSVVIAAYNEEKVIARTVQALLDSRYPNLEIIVVDDGSRDFTAQAVEEAFAGEPRVRLLRKENGGKASALNLGILEAQGEILVALDADTLFAPDTIYRLVRHFADPRVGAVSGNVQVGNAHNLLTRWQALEYTTSQNFDRRAYDLLNCITVVPGAVGALRRTAVIGVGGYTHDTLAEDTDLTWKLRRAGWRITNDSTAMAYTEAPETLRNLAKQRFRWAFGTLQCLWKHREALGQHGAFGWIALPSLWLYQMLFPAVSPFMDVAMLWSFFAGNWAQLGAFYLLMFAIEFVAALIATRLGRGNPRLLPWLFFQRFVYRQLMYYVVLKSLVAAIRGGAVGWNKFERTGTARIESNPV